jgi:hypothetical protein
MELTQSKESEMSRSNFSSNGKVRVGAVTGPATVKGSNGPVTVDKLGDVTIRRAPRMNEEA